MKLSSIISTSLATMVFFLFSHSAKAETQAIIEMSRVPAKGKSQIWSPLFQATWDKINALHQGKPLKSDQQNKLITALDSYQWHEEKVMPKGAYAVYAGTASKEFIEATRAKIKKDFSVDLQANEIPLNPSANAAFGILIRDLQFKKPFLKSKNTPLAFVDSHSNTYKVQFFGSAKEYSSGYRASVKVLDYQNEGREFTISMATKTPGERVIIYRPSVAMSMEAAIKKVANSIDKPIRGEVDKLDDPNLHGYDRLKIPYITLQSETDFTSQLQGLRFFKGDPTPWRVSMAKQFTQFALHEKGARVKVETQGGMEPFGEPVKPIPRNFICDRPFYVFLWKDNAAMPYLALWVDSVDVLKIFKK